MKKKKTKKLKQKKVLKVMIMNKKDKINLILFS